MDKTRQYIDFSKGFVDYYDYKYKKRDEDFHKFSKKSVYVNVDDKIYEPVYEGLDIKKATIHTSKEDFFKKILYSRQQVFQGKEIGDYKNPTETSAIDEFNKTLHQTVQFYKKYIASDANGDYNFITFNTEMLIEFVRSNKVHLLQTYGLLRILGRDHGGFFSKNPNYSKIRSSTLYRHQKQLRELGFITREKVNSHRDIMFKHARTSEMARVPVTYFRPSRLEGLKSYITCITAQGIIERQNKNKAQGIHRFDSRSRRWICERLDRSKLWSDTVKFNDKTLDGGIVSNSILANTLNKDERTIQRWLASRLAPCSMLYIHHSVTAPTNLVPDVVSKKRNWNWVKGLSNVKRYSFTDRFITPIVKIYRNDYLVKPYLRKFYQTSKQKAAENSYGTILSQLSTITSNTTNDKAKTSKLHLFSTLQYTPFYNNKGVQKNSKLSSLEVSNFKKQLTVIPLEKISYSKHILKTIFSKDNSLRYSRY